MKAAIICAGTRGDHEPYAALSVALAKRGIESALAFNPGFDAETLLAGGGEGGTLAQLLWLKKALEPALRRSFAATLEAAAGADIVIGSLLAISAGHVAEKLGVPFVAAYLQPATRTKEHPIASWNGPNLGPLNPLTYLGASFMSKRMIGRAVNDARRSIGLAPSERALPAGDRIVYGYSEAVMPQPCDWPDHVRVSGYWTRDELRPLEPALETWLRKDNDRAVVSFGFGSMREAAFTRYVDAAIAKLGCRAVVVGDWYRGEHEDVYVTPSAPYAALFPQVDVVVHHGGAGTTAAALHAGTPQVVVPHLGDQAFWARRVATLNAGVGPLARKSLRPGPLIAAIDACLREPEKRASASAISARLRSERGADRAAAIIGELL